MTACTGWQQWNLRTTNLSIYILIGWFMFQLKPRECMEKNKFFLCCFTYGDRLYGTPSDSSGNNWWRHWTLHINADHSMGRKQFLNDEMDIEKLDFYCYWLFVNYENWWGRPQHLLAGLCNTLAVSKQRILLCWLDKGHKSAFFEGSSNFVTKSWHLRDLTHPSLFAEGVSNHSCSLFLYFATLFACIMLDLVQKVADIRPKFCPVC